MRSGTWQRDQGARGYRRLRSSSQLSPQEAGKLFKEIWFAHSLNKLCVLFFLSPLKVRSLEKLPVYLPSPLAYLDPLSEHGGQAWVKS